MVFGVDTNPATRTAAFRKQVRNLAILCLTSDHLHSKGIDIFKIWQALRGQVISASDRTTEKPAQSLLEKNVGKVKILYTGLCQA